MSSASAIAAMAAPIIVPPAATPDRVQPH